MNSVLRKITCMLLVFFAFSFNLNVYGEERNTQLSKGHYLIINSNTNRMGYFKDGKLVKEFKVATGKASTPTPQGKFRIVNKIKNRPYFSGGIPGGDPRNPLGDRWIGLQVGATYGTTYAIHGNNNASSIGKHISGGCVRMYNDEVRWLFDRIPVGSHAIIENSSRDFIEIANKYGIQLERKNDIKGHWAEQSILEAMNKGWITKSDIFRPDEPITRAEFIKIVNKVYGFNEVLNVNFKDVKNSDWFYQDLKIAIGSGYIKGYEDSTFRPNNKLTREEAASIITYINNNKDENLDKLRKYKDAYKVSSYLKSSVEGSIESGYMIGYKDNTFRPKSNITRAEALVMLQKSK